MFGKKTMLQNIDRLLSLICQTIKKYGQKIAYKFFDFIKVLLLLSIVFLPIKITLKRFLEGFLARLFI